MLDQLPQVIRKDIRNLRNMIDSDTRELNLHSIEEKFRQIDALRHHIGDCIVSILLKEDEQRIDYFLTHK